MKQTVQVQEAGGGLAAEFGSRGLHLVGKTLWVGSSLVLSGLLPSKIESSQMIGAALDPETLHAEYHE